MSKAPSLTDISQRRTIGSLHRALDHTYRQLLQTAKTDWHRLFAGQDPSDTCVSVHISKEELANELAGTPRAGFVPIRNQRINGTARRRLA